jgi:hypothetical protein
MTKANKTASRYLPPLVAISGSSLRLTELRHVGTLSRLNPPTQDVGRTRNSFLVSGNPATLESCRASDDINEHANARRSQRSSRGNIDLKLAGGACHTFAVGRKLTFEWQEQNATWRLISSL